MLDKYATDNTANKCNAILVDNVVKINRFSWAGFEILSAIKNEVIKQLPASSSQVTKHLQVLMMMRLISEKSESKSLVLVLII